VGVAAALLVGEDQQRDNGSAAYEPKPARHLSAVGDPRGDAAGQALVVLLVEDDAAMRFLVSYNLEASGFRVVTAATGQEGVELAASEKPDLVLLDVMLPDLGGFEVAQQLRGVPIVFVSARAAESDLEQGRAAGAIDYVTKPFDPVTLGDRLREDLQELRRGDGGAERVWRMRFGE
jgi:DNA-binding response OmpR family regulator